jgi:hypothetical protein
MKGLQALFASLRRPSVTTALSVLSRPNRYALAWNVQAVPHSRLTETSSQVTDNELADIRAQICACVEG